MTVRSKILTGPDVITAGNTIAFGPPAGATYVIRTITMVNSSAAAVPFAIGIGGTAAGQLIVGGLTVPANGRRIFEERWYLPAPRSLFVANLHGVQAITVTVFGAILDGVAP